MESQNTKKPFIEREWSEDIEGKLDSDGFFITPNGSFWDADYVYFNREGFDKHGGRYDSNGEYVPGPGWDDELNCYESEKEKCDDEKEENEFDEGYTEEAMMKELAQFDDEDDLFEGKDLIKEDPNIEKVVKYENEVEKDEFMDEVNDKKDDKKEENKISPQDDLEEREDDEYEEIEDEEKEDLKDKKDNKENKDNANKNSINIEKEKKTFVVKTHDGDIFTIKQSNDDNNNLNKIETDNKINENKNNLQYNKDGIEYEINYIDQKWKYKNNNNKYYKDKYYYKDYKDYKDNNYKKNNKNKKQKQFKNYNIFDDEDKKK